MHNMIEVKPKLTNIILWNIQHKFYKCMQNKAPSLIAQLDSILMWKYSWTSVHNLKNIYIVWEWAA